MKFNAEQKPQSKAKDQAQDIVVFWLVNRKDTNCSQCGKELGKGNFLTIDKGKGLCMECADLDHLIFLGAGDHALTRRARKYSTLWAVVVRHSRARRRYERQGLLVEEEALARAEEECLADADLREVRREREAYRRLDQDKALAESMRLKLREMFPGCPAKEAETIARHTSERGSGRVGRSEAGRNLDEEALRLAAVAYIRHRYTNYDRLLMQGMDRQDARESVRDKIAETVEKWCRTSNVIDNPM